jgi:hypothetical protein
MIRTTKRKRGGQKHSKTQLLYALGHIVAEYKELMAVPSSKRTADQLRRRAVLSSYGSRLRTRIRTGVWQ